MYGVLVNLDLMVFNSSRTTVDLARTGDGQRLPWAVVYHGLTVLSLSLGLSYA